jgi:predicted dienelactone hydrolase
MWFTRHATDLLFKEMPKRTLCQDRAAAPALGFTFSYGGLNGVDIPVQLWRAENDVFLPHPWYAEAVRKSLRKEPDYHSVAKAGHFDFLAPCSEKLLSLAPQICASEDGFDREIFHRRFNAEVVSFFIKSLSPT